MSELLDKHIDKLGTVLLLFKSDPHRAPRELEEEKRSLEDDREGADEITAAALYNALATIRTSLEQIRPTGQLIAAISDARDELRIINGIGELEE